MTLMKLELNFSDLCQLALVVIALIELLGAILLAPVFIKDFGVGKGIWYGVFHSISALCNAGFDLMGVRQQYSSLS